ncbi:NAD(P)(+) transhydrogenase (Re/Si-specific) subunit beta [Nitratireductor sp. GCM10026969]|uniref:NAD(P)(+) transhydrogenase (Re/Si-specific) subunit beta n=1 Tax=Nitratireductor sp. GCM10026969 TaxID=3252645 RepID=UPI003614E559
MGLLTASYVGSSILFILSIAGLRRHETALRGNFYGMAGMAIAIVATLFAPQVGNYQYLLPAMIAGAGVGVLFAQRVQMTQMPQLVAVLNGLVGLAAVFVGINSALHPPGDYAGAQKIIHDIEILLGIFIGGATFTGSLVASGKLQGAIPSRSVLVPMRHALNVALVVACIALGTAYLAGAELWSLVAIALVAFVLGANLALAIGGADMPVVVSMFNSYSGWAAAATGFMLGNDLLIVTGALVGSSGAILSYIMCRGMNRDFLSVVLGGFGGAQAAGQKIDGEMMPVDADGVTQLMREAESVIIVPGYGLAVAQAQHALSGLISVLRAAGKTVRFAIHPVAGRLPGHMNVLLAEAKVPYDLVLEMEEINDDFADTDLAVVVGANDIVNPAAKEEENSPIAGMPVLEVWNAKNVIVSKRGQGTGYSGVENTLFYRENTRMYYGDAKASLEELVKRLRV